MSRRGSSLSYLFGGDDDEKKKEVVPKKKDDDVAPTLSKSISSNAYASGSNQVCYHLSLSMSISIMKVRHESNETERWKFHHGSSDHSSTCSARRSFSDIFRLRHGS